MADDERPLHHRFGALAWVFAGGLAGTALRALFEQIHPAQPGGWPWTTFLINLTGAVILGALLEALAGLGVDDGWRQRTRLAVGTGFCGSLTTYSSLSLEVAELGRHDAPLVAIGYGVGSVLLGIVCAGVGIAVGGAATRTFRGEVS